MTSWIWTLCLLACPVDDDNLISNGSFESGTDGWQLINNSGRAELSADRRTHRKGRQALRVAKTGGPPFDVVRTEIRSLPKGGRLEVSAFLKGRNVERAFLKFFLWDEKEESLDPHVDLRLLTGSFNWL